MRGPLILQPASALRTNIASGSLSCEITARQTISGDDNTHFSTLERSPRILAQTYRGGGGGAKLQDILVSNIFFIDKHHLKKIKAGVALLLVTLVKYRTECTVQGMQSNKN